jgi:arylamine N-acetyltransferase
LIELAKLSEEAHFEVKNRYRHDKKTMQFAEKRRMPVDEKSVRDMLRNQHLFRMKINKEIPNYNQWRDTSQFEHGLLTYLREGSYGELADLVKEVGIKRDTIPFYNLNEYRKYKDNFLHESDDQF